jgi:hypothetical protein
MKRRQGNYSAEVTEMLAHYWAAAQRSGNSLVKRLSRARAAQALRSGRSKRRSHVN